jgi:hypothetical protein
VRLQACVTFQQMGAQVGSWPLGIEMTACRPVASCSLLICAIVVSQTTVAMRHSLVR